MKRSGLFAGALFALSVLPASATLSIPNPVDPRFVAYAHPRSYFEGHANLVEPEQVRIRRHLATVEAELRTRPMDGLSPSQRIHRLARLNDLHTYWTRGEFPKNLDFPDRLIPYFIDAAGVPCAMGYLVIASGHGDFAQEIERTRNNAYIGEIAAADPRLARWAKAEGMTLEEAAMVQPAYGGPALSSVTHIQLDGFSRPWAFGADGNNIGATSAFYRDSSQWKLAASTSFAGAFCVTPSGLPVMAFGTTLVWKTRNYALDKGVTVNSCDWGSEDSTAWVGTNKGLARFQRSGSTDTLVRTMFTTSLASDTVTGGVAVVAGAVWAGTRTGVYRRGLLGADTLVTAWDSTALMGFRATGVKAAGSMVWVGMDGVPVIPGLSFVSRKGLRRYNGSIWSRYVSSASSVMLPNDTINALAIRDSGSVWIAVSTGFYRFAATASTPKVADIPSGATVYDMVGTANGFYAGTSLGVYQFRNDSLVFLGKPAVVALRPALAGKGFYPASRLRLLSGKLSDPTDIRSLLGRKAGPRAGAGVYVAEPPQER